MKGGGLEALGRVRGWDLGEVGARGGLDSGVS